MSTIEWRFQGRRSECGACKAEYAAGERHVSVLSIAGEELLREDLCVSCFEKRDPAASLFYWFTRHHVDRRRLHLDLATLEQLFLRLESRGEQKLRELRYVLCLLLMRKRRLKLVRIERDADGERLLVKRPRRADTCSVFVYDFAPERVDELRQELVAIFDGSEPGQWVEVGEPTTAETASSGGSSDDPRMVSSESV
jgi:hypothetical protein